LKVNDAVEALAGISRRPCFQTSAESMMKIKDSYLAAKAHAALFDKLPAVEVKCRNGVVNVKIETALSLEDEVTATIQDALKYIDDIKAVRVNVVPFDTGD